MRSDINFCLCTASNNAYFSVEEFGKDDFEIISFSSLNQYKLSNDMWRVTIINKKTLTLLYASISRIGDQMRNSSTYGNRFSLTVVVGQVVWIVVRWFLRL